jgi:GDP-L-fucose synthase
MSTFWEGRRVLVTGGNGFIGGWAVDKLLELRADLSVTVRPGTDSTWLRRRNLNILAADLEIPENCHAVCRRQEVILSFAHKDGSGDYKRRHPASLFRQNMSITFNLMEAAARSGVERMLITSSAEVYAPDSAVPTSEAAAFRNLEGTYGDGYGWSKRMSELAAALYSREYGIKLAIARPSNVYGPRDTVDLARGRVVPMFVLRVLRGEPIVIWGDGQQVRTFLYVEDFVRGAIDLTERHATGEPVNFSGDEQITIGNLAATIARLAGQPLDICCQTDKPAGSPRRILDTTRATEVIGFKPRIGLEEGLRLTIDSYRHLGSLARAAAAESS